MSHADNLKAAQAANPNFASMTASERAEAVKAVGQLYTVNFPIDPEATGWQRAIETSVTVRATDKADAIAKACERVTTLTPAMVTGVGIY